MGGGGGGGLGRWGGKTARTWDRCRSARSTAALRARSTMTCPAVEAAALMDLDRCPSSETGPRPSV